MVVLLIDVGNSCVKYCLLDSVSSPAMHLQRLPSADWQACLQQLTAALPSVLDWVAISCVGHAEQLHSLQRELAPRCAADVRVAAVVNHWQGFELHYADVSRLGVDRWLAMLAIREQLKNNELAILADCGTATTVECLSRAEHLGGVIAPGLGLMRKALNVDTADLPEVNADGRQLENWSCNSEAAIANGCNAATVGLLERQYRLMPSAALAVLTGGDALAMASQLPAWKVDEMLVLEGLRLWACLEK